MKLTDKELKIFLEGLSRDSVADPFRVIVTELLELREENKRMREAIEFVLGMTIDVNGHEVVAHKAVLREALQGGEK